MEALGASNASEGRLDVGLVDAVYSHWVTETKSVEGALEGLELVASDETRPALERSKSRLSQAHLHWQYGDRERALEVVDTALELSETVDGTLLKARLLDASGDESGAAEWYRKALDATDLEEEREFIRIRLAMIGVDRRNVEGLVDLARDRDQEFKNRAAITLAVLGHPDRALELYRPDSESPRHFRQLVRVAEWALKAGDHATAREHAWRAYDSTELRFDALYALTLVDEAYRGEGRMDDLVVELEARGVENEDLLDLRIDLLIDLERYDDAIDLFHAINRDTSDVEARMRLIQIYDTAGKSSEMVSEYENLIEREPMVVQWYVGLASYHINVAEPERALEVWERFEESNRDRIEVLVLGGEFMNQMGYVAEATAMVERHAAAHGPSVYGNVFLFETHFARGREVEAEQAVEELWASLPPDSSDLRVVADSFERLRKFERALDVFEAIREHEGKLGYDDRMRLAWLHNVVGNQETALELWREIWVAEEAPARRSFAESQLLQIAAELNALADMAVDLEGKLYSGEADRNEMNLLVRIYTEVGDAFSATEIVKEFARSTDMPEVDKLRQLGLVYLQLQEYSKYDEVLRRLEQIDPEHRLEHIQNIVLNLLAYDLAEGTNEKYEDIQHWLEELRRYDAEAVSGEFEASVLSMGGFSDEAIESYRRALIEQPEHSDNLLLMADLMKEDDRTMEAVALLQYVAEHAVDDNEFVVAVDGIINMVGQRMFFQQLSAEVESVFRWTHRVILERITGREDKFYLYTLLSEIAQETNDREGEFEAMENSVSEAGIRRLAVLREIVTMATPNAGFFTIYQNEGDPERQLRYGRRLIGLRQQLPPEVYISIARTLLTQGDTVGAERSLSLVRDITGQIDVVKTKADLFLEAGYSKQALASYSQALTVNRDSLELQFKTAALREGNGQLDVANALYASALDKVMRGLP
ncbi:MAG: tetratricopeptide repeat protein, partial [Gammaproteobacteria bacterium]|nr:tetratricopeptide repeat protein [Gammaproteobacteria bacterium]